MKPNVSVSNKPLWDDDSSDIRWRYEGGGMGYVLRSMAPQSPVLASVQRHWEGWRAWVYQSPTWDKPTPTWAPVGDFTTKEEAMKAAQTELLLRELAKDEQ